MFYFAASIALMILYRYIVKQTLRNLRSNGFNKQFIIILGAGSLGKKYYRNVINHP
jgi:FlaA1/EpsC-like NDP-sugar epimerase